ncbi:hypothetical protein [Spirosoma rigui]|uniref:hypothetical protein n=1 Tax=Spirosoma rigui TaxID=564064 RepID=UPI0009B0431F|nr:hypothetical protein [Spirosoma rigui]
MNLSDEHQALVDFFARITLPTGFQHVNEYSLFLDLPGATKNYIKRLHSAVESDRKSAALALNGIRDWVLQQEMVNEPALESQF